MRPDRPRAAVRLPSAEPGRSRKSIHRAIITVAASLALCAAPIAAQRPGATLRVILVDVEGGAATLFVTPQNHVLLIDTGWPAGLGGSRQTTGSAPTPSSAQRIAAVLRKAGLKGIDYLLITHFHTDHVGGAVELMGLVPVGTVIDHGPNREPPPANADAQRLATAPATLYANYIAAIGTRVHRIMKPGEQLRIDDLSVTAVDGDGEIIDHPLGAGEPGAGCAAATRKDVSANDENPRSLGTVLTWGKARLLALGDTTWTMENRLACPRDLIGPIDLMIADNHGTANANSPQLIDTVKPRIVIFNNGVTKGQDAESFRTVMASPRIKSVWQLHVATRSPEQNTAPERIANLTNDPDAMYPLAIAVAKSGAITVTNPRLQTGNR